LGEPPPGFLSPGESSPPATGFAYVFPFLLALMLAGAWLARRDRPVALAFMAFSVVWVLLLCCFVDGYEGNRMRYSTEAFLFIGAAHGAERCIAVLRDICTGRNAAS
jgi:hypothetical protein